MDKEPADFAWIARFNNPALETGPLECWCKTPDSDYLRLIEATARLHEGIADTQMTRRTKGGLVRWLGTAMAAGVIGLVALFGGVGVGIAVVAYLERTGALPPPAHIAAQRPSIDLAYPPFRRPYEEPVAQAVAAPPKVAKIPRAPAGVAPAPTSGVDKAPGVGPGPQPGPATGTQEDPAWMLAALPVPIPQDRPMVAIIFDDLAVDQARSRRAIALPGPLTMSFLPYGSNLADLAAAARERGHEIMVHLPMEPTDPETDPGPDALLSALGAEEVRARLILNLGAIDGYIGVNNHMGSKFTSFEPGMRPVMEEIHRRGLLYVDSLTTPDTVAADLAASLNMPYLARDVFLDYDRQPETVEQQLLRLEKIAKARGYAIGIGHPYDATIDVVRQWLETADERGFAVVPVSVIARISLAMRG